MASLINFPIDLTRTGDALQGIRTELSRIADALERLSPAIPVADRSRPAGLSDLRRTDPDSVSRIKSELELFAENNNVMLDSEAFVRSIIEYEHEVAEVYGIEAIDELPWNKAAGGSLFQDYADNERRKEAQRAQGGAAVPDPEPPAHSA